LYICFKSPQSACQRTRSFYLGLFVENEYWSMIFLVAMNNVPRFTITGINSQWLLKEFMLFYVISIYSRASNLVQRCRDKQTGALPLPFSFIISWWRISALRLPASWGGPLTTAQSLCVFLIGFELNRPNSDAALAISGCASHWSRPEIPWYFLISTNESGLSSILSPASSLLIRFEAFVLEFGEHIITARRACVGRIITQSDLLKIPNKKKKICLNQLCFDVLSTSLSTL
jgi:hypothetical protein